jgi:hypothetical protein
MKSKIILLLFILFICVDGLAHVQLQRLRTSTSAKPTALALHLRLRGGVSPMKEEAMALRELNSLALQACGDAMENKPRLSTNTRKQSLRKHRGPVNHGAKVMHPYSAELNTSLSLSMLTCHSCLCCLPGCVLFFLEMGHSWPPMLMIRETPCEQTPFFFVYSCMNMRVCVCDLRECAGAHLCTCLREICVYIHGLLFNAYRHTHTHTHTHTHIHTHASHVIRQRKMRCSHLKTRSQLLMCC